MILDEIVVKRREQLEIEKNLLSEEKVREEAYACDYQPRKFEQALVKPGLSVVAEIKKASPSKGIIREEFDPVSIAKMYEEGGASAISILTEQYYFKGDNAYIPAVREAVNLPILRKDFIIDPYQIYHAKVLGADAVLLIAALLSKDVLRKYLKLAADLGLSCLVEVHNEQELAVALACDARIIGINNRDLKTFHVDLSVTERLVRLIPKEKVVVSESGVLQNGDVCRVKAAGAHAVLMGEVLMRKEDPVAMLKQMRETVCS